jgi:hypothetical protein
MDGEVSPHAAHENLNCERCRVPLVASHSQVSLGPVSTDPTGSVTTSIATLSRRRTSRGLHDVFHHILAELKTHLRANTC